MDRPIDFWKKKWKNVKELSRKREQYVKKQSTTGAGKLTKAELKVVESPQYLDLARKLGKSAKGCDSRLDSDSTNAAIPPTNRLRNVLSSTNESIIDDASKDVETGKYFMFNVFISIEIFVE